MDKVDGSPVSMRVGYLDTPIISTNTHKTINNFSNSVLSSEAGHSHQLSVLHRRQHNYGALLEAQGMVLGQRAGCLLDDGATGDFISVSFTQRLHITPVVVPARQVNLAIKGKDALYQCNLGVTVSLALGPLVETRYFDVVDLDHYDIILGMPWHKNHNPCKNWKEKTVFVTLDNGHCVQLVGQRGQGNVTQPGGIGGQPGINITRINLLQTKRLIRKEGTELYLSLVREAQEGQGEQKPAQPQVQELLQEYKDIFPDDLPKGLLPSRALEHHIELVPGAEPIARAPFRLSFGELQEMKKQLDELLEKGHIQPSVSPFGAPVLFIKKKDGALRMCIDYQLLNQLTVKNRYALPWVDDLLDQLQGATVWPTVPQENQTLMLRIGSSIPTADTVRGTFGKALSINRPTHGSAPCKKG